MAKFVLNLETNVILNIYEKRSWAYLLFFSARAAMVKLSIDAERTRLGESVEYGAVDLGVEREKFVKSCTRSRKAKLLKIVFVIQFLNRSQTAVCSSLVYDIINRMLFHYF